MRKASEPKLKKLNADLVMSNIMEIKDVKLGQKKDEMEELVQQKTLKEKNAKDVKDKE